VPNRDLIDWAGGRRVTLAIVLTDIVGSTVLRARMKDERMRQVLHAHFSKSDELIAKHQGRLIKTLGDGVMAVFRTAADALDCARDLHANPGAEELRLRACIHIGAIDVDENDIGGIEIHIASRIMSGIVDPEIWVSDRTKDDIDHLGAQQHLALRWRRHDRVKLKGLEGRPFRLWSLAAAIELMPAVKRRPVAEQRAAMRRTKPVRSRSPAVSLAVMDFNDRPAIAVLPFANFSGNADLSHFSDGIADEIIDELSSWRLFPVIARNSSFAFKNQSLEISEIGRRVGARYVLEGSVNTIGQRVRISARLVDAATNLQVATERFDRRSDELPDAHDQVTEMIVGSITPEVLRAERRRAMQLKPRANLTSYEFFLRGLEAHYAYTKPDNAEAQIYFRKAIEADPSNAQALATLAHAMLHAVQLGWRNDEAHNYAVADGLALRAVALDPRAPSGHFALGCTSMMLGHIEGALREVREAIRINPSHAAAHAMIAPLLCYIGQPGIDGLESARRAIRLSPYDPRLGLWLISVAIVQYFLADYAEAARMAQQAIALIPENPIAYRFAAASFAQLGRGNEALPFVNVIRQSSTPTIEAIRQSVSQLYRDPQMIEHMLDGLRKSGLD
jgi:adenylate cyclase